MAKQIVTQDQMMDLLDKCYTAATKGIPGGKTCEELAADYMNNHHDTKIAAQKMIATQVAKCTASGFITNLGGLITLPVAIPANLASVLYVQVRMIAALAVMGGYNLRHDEVQTLVYLCLVRSSITDICKSAGIQIANKMTISLLKKLPGTVLTKVNQKVGFRLLTKFGEKGIINIGKGIPLAGGIVGGAIDCAGTKLIANKAYKTFLLNDLT